MPGLLDRLFGPRAPALDYQRGPRLAGVDAITARAIELQKAYWRPNPERWRELEGQGLDALDWPDRLRLHHQRCLALLDVDNGALRHALLAPASEASTAVTSAGLAHEQVAASAKVLLARRSPFRPRHGFVWLGEQAPAGDAVPYSDFQGRMLDASLTHLGSLEVVRLDDEFEPAALEFIAFDEIMTVSRGRLTDPAAPFVPARILREYGLPELIVWLPLRHGLTWFAFEPTLVRGLARRSVAATELGNLADPSKALGNALDRRPLGICVGPQQFEVLSDYAQEGLGRFELRAAYQLSLAIDQDDPRFVDKCRGRGLDPQATRNDVVREARLRASAQAARKRD